MTKAGANKPHPPAEKIAEVELFLKLAIDWAKSQGLKLDFATLICYTNGQFVPGEFGVCPWLAYLVHQQPTWDKTKESEWDVLAREFDVPLWWVVGMYYAVFNPQAIAAKDLNVDSKIVVNNVRAYAQEVLTESAA